MPNRILREGILDSDRVNSLSYDSEVFYRRLMSVVDDHGRFDGRTSIIKARLYALRPTTRETDISRWIAECVKAGLIALYSVDSKPYLLFHRLGEARARFSKYPDPPADICSQLKLSASGCAQTRADEINREQTQANVPYSSSDSTTSTNAIKDPPTPHESEFGSESEFEEPDRGDEPWDEKVIPLPHANTEFVNAWREWVAMRAAKKKTVTNRIARLSIEKLRKAGFSLTEATECVFESAANGWLGLVTDRILKNRTSGGNSKASGRGNTKADAEVARFKANAEIVRQTERELAERTANEPVATAFGIFGEPLAIGPAGVPGGSE